MATTRWDQRFFSTTRGQIISLLRRASQTVEELAATLGLTDNAIRTHLSTLERDGLVAQRGTRRGLGAEQGARRGRGKPAFAYELTPEAELIFPKAHATVLAELVGTLEEELGPAETGAILRTVGRQLAVGRVHPDADLEARLTAAVQLLNDLGGLAELETRDGDYYVRGYSCPLGPAAHERPQLCHLAEALVSEVVGAPVQECCDASDRPRCCFRLGPLRAD